MGRYAAVGGALYEIELLEAGPKLRCRPHAGEAATVTLKTDSRVKTIQMQLAHVDGLQFATLDATGPVRLVPGDYRFARAMVGLLPKGKAAAPPKKSLLERLFGGGSSGPPLLMLSGFGEEAPPVTIRPGSQTLSPGPPFTLAFEAGCWGARREQVKIGSVHLTGGAGERYRADVSGPDVESSLTCHVRAGGETQELRKLEFG